MAALSRFISRLGEKVMLLYKLLKKVDKYSGPLKLKKPWKH
jgi:flavoprotein